MKQESLVIYYILTSFIFFFLLILLNFFTPSTNILKEIDRIIIFLIFILICFLGFTLSFYPRWYKKIFKKKNNKIIKPDLNYKKRNRVGHHPNCLKFKNHIIKIKGRNYCTGCFGLGVGSLSSIFLMILYITIGENQYIMLYQYSFFVGLLIIILSYIETLINNKNSIIHILSNIFLIIGFLIISISTLENSSNLIYGLIGILASFLFLETRIQISMLNHTNICSNCIEQCKMY